MATPQRTPDTLEISIEGRLKSLHTDDAKLTIFRVPAHVREANKLVYEPRMVSIGPYYRGREELRAMEKLKWRYLQDLLRRAGDARGQKPGLSSFVQAVRQVEERAWGSYYEQTKLFGIGKEASVQSVTCGSPGNAEPSEQAQSDGFAEMLLLDGCFILEFLFKWLEEDGDSLQSIGWGVDLLNSDLLLLENQIPFFVLKSLYTVLSIGREPKEGSQLPTPEEQLLNDLYTLLKDDAIPQKISRTDLTTISTMKIHHLLHLYYEAFVPKPEPRDIQPGDNSLSEQDPEEEHASGGNSAKEKAQRYSRLDNTVIPCTTQLREAGVRFRSKKHPKHMFDITFSNGVMEIPTFVIDYATTPLLFNLIAFEQGMVRNKGAAAPLTSYTALMTALIRTGKDVEVMEKHNIMKNMLSNEDDAAKSYFNQLGTFCTLDYNKHYYASEFAELNKYYNSNCNKYKGKFRRDYCANPCTIVTLLAVVLGFFITVGKVPMDLYRPRAPH